MAMKISVVLCGSSRLPEKRAMFWLGSTASVGQAHFRDRPLPGVDNWLLSRAVCVYFVILPRSRAGPAI